MNAKVNRMLIQLRFGCVVNGKRMYYPVNEVARIYCSAIHCSPIDAMQVASAEQLGFVIEYIEDLAPDQLRAQGAI